MPINQRRKGAVGERELAAFLKQHGFEARRGQQHAGGGDSPDVVHNIPSLHIECKRTEKLSVYEAVDQAKRDSFGTERAPTVFHRRNRKDWLVIMYADDFLEIMKEVTDV